MKLKRIMLDQDGYSMFIGSIELAILENTSDQPLTANEVHTILIKESYTWAYSTIKETLDRLVAKGWLSTVGQIYNPIRYTRNYTPDQIVTMHLAKLLANLENTLPDIYESMLKI